MKSRLQCNLHEQQLTLLRTTHNHLNWFSKGRNLLRSLGNFQSFKSDKLGYEWEDVIQTPCGVIRVREYSQDNGYRPFARMWITNEARTDPQGYHGLLTHIHEILVEQAGVLYRPSYSEISTDSDDESIAGAWLKYAVPKRIDFEKDAYWFDSKSTKKSGFNSDPKSNQYFKGRKDGIHFNSYPKDIFGLHYEIRLKRTPLYGDNINTIQALLSQAPNLLAKRIYFMALNDDASRDLKAKNSAEAYMILCRTYPKTPRGKIRKIFFDQLPLPTIPLPTVHNIYNDLFPLSLLQPINISIENNVGNNTSQIFDFDYHDTALIHESGNCC